MSDERATAALAVVRTMVDALNADYQGHWYTVHDVLHLLRTLGAAGYALVPAADVLTPEERAILRECEALDDATLHAPVVHADMLYPLCDAIQRARRAAKKANRG